MKRVFKIQLHNITWFMLHIFPHFFLLFLCVKCHLHIWNMVFEAINFNSVLNKEEAEGVFTIFTTKGHFLKHMLFQY